MTQPPVANRVLRSRNEINLTRLLSRCEAMLADKKPSWRLEAYTAKLEELLDALEKQSTLQPSLERLNELRKKVQFIKGVLEVDKSSPEMKLIEQAKLSQYPEREVQQRQEAKLNRELRETLFRSDKTSQKKPTQDVDQILREQGAMQQQIAESMVSLAQDLKRNAQTAKEIIAKDTEVVKRNLQNTEDNYGRLQKESERLEKKLKFSCSCHCTMWLLLLFVCLVFLKMVVFIRFFPKRY